MNENQYTARNAVTEGFSSHAHKRSWVLPIEREQVWRWLHDPKTFTQGQPPSFRVEFIAAEGNTTNDFLRESSALILVLS